jgi:hypothetical protein
LAIDKNVLSYSSTNDEANAYLLLTFGQTHSLKELTIRNRYCTSVSEGVSDICKGYLSNAKIEFINSNGLVKVTASLPDMSSVTDYTMLLTSNSGC